MNQRQIEDLARKIMQADPRLGWQSAWIKAIRMINSLESL